MYQHLYQLFLKANENKLHMASHSHHFWPDCSLDAHIQYWHDSARLTDKKWEYFFTTKVPETSNLIRRVIRLPETHEFIYAPNTHELITRLLSCFGHDDVCTVLTTDSEFYSFQRQMNRLCETKKFVCKSIPTESFDDFNQRFSYAIDQTKPNLVFISRVFFNSGFACDIQQIIQKCQNENIFLVIDDYHGFMALPIDLSFISSRTFYLAGSYKYAQGGEGCCFMAVPKNSSLRPIDTGWFTQIGGLKNVIENIPVDYPNNEFRFAGSTMDFTALYRLNAVLSEFEKNKIDVAKINNYIRELQRFFLHELDNCNHHAIHSQHLVVKDLNQCGHFLTFKCNSPELTIKIQKELENRGIITDGRGSRLRIGFGLYQNKKFNLANYLIGKSM